VTHEPVDLAFVARVRAGVALSIALLAALAWMARRIEPDGTRAGWTPPLTLAGLVSPVIGFRLFAWRRERFPAAADPAGRRAAYARALAAALGVTAAVAVAGLWAHLLSGEPGPLAGLVTHVLLAGALWPSPEGLAGFGEPER